MTTDRTILVRVDLATLTGMFEETIATWLGGNSSINHLARNLATIVGGHEVADSALTLPYERAVDDPDAKGGGG
jgi:hypothetical protein